MTFWAKLFVVILFILSLVFATASGVLFAKREHYRQNFKNLQEAYDRENERLSNRNAELENDLEDVRTARRSADDKLTELDTQHRAVVSAHEKLKGEYTELDKELEKEKADNLLFASANATLTKSNDELRITNQGLDRKNLELETTLRARETTIAELETTRTKLKNEVSDLKVALEDKRKELDWAEAVFDELRKRDIGVDSLLASFRFVPDIQAQITGVSLDVGVVILNAGSEEGVRKNFDFTLFRGDDYVATARVFNCDQHQSAAMIVMPKDANVQIGDSGRTLLP